MLQIATADDEDRDEETSERDGRAHPERGGEPVGERHRLLRAAGERIIGRRDGDRGEDRYANGATDLLRRVDETRRKSASSGFVPATAAMKTGTYANGMPSPMMRKPGKRSFQ